MKNLAVLLMLLGQVYFDEAEQIATAQTILSIVQQAAGRRKTVVRAHLASKKKVQRTQILMLTARWCGGCTSFKNGPLVKLRKAKWTDEHIMLIDVDEHPEILEKYDPTFLPAFILLEDGVEVRNRRVEQYIDQWQVGRLFRGEQVLKSK